MSQPFWTHTVQILVMLGIAFALGLWLGYLLWHKWRRLHDKLQGEMAVLSARLSDCENARASNLAAAVHRDDLKIIEGIGPKIEKLCNGVGIFNFQQLAQTPVGRLQKMLADAGPDYKVAAPDTWPRQAELAAAGKWDELKSYQAVLKGGRSPG